MMRLRPIIINNDNMILGGNMRFMALAHLEYKEIPDDWVRRANELTEDEQRRFVIADNVAFGEHDWDKLANEWDAELLDAWGVDLPEWKDPEEPKDAGVGDAVMYKIELEFSDESEQEIAYEKLTQEGYKCQILTL